MRSLSILLAGIASLAATPALADEAYGASGDEAAEIRVSGVRQAYRGDFAPNEIPQAIAVIDAKQLEENNILWLTDALDLNASVARQNNFGDLWDSFAVHGFAIGRGA